MGVETRTKLSCHSRTCFADSGRVVGKRETDSYVFDDFRIARCPSTNRELARIYLPTTTWPFWGWAVSPNRFRTAAATTMHTSAETDSAINIISELHRSWIQP